MSEQVAELNSRAYKMNIEANKTSLTMFAKEMTRWEYVASVCFHDSKGILVMSNEQWQVKKQWPYTRAHEG